MKKKVKIFGLILFIAGIIIGAGSLSMTGNVIGSTEKGFISIIGICLIFVGAAFMAAEVSGLERKLGQISDVKIRRELISDAHRAEDFAERGLDVNGLWDPSKSYEENKRQFLDTFYNNVDFEISDGYMKSKDLDLPDIYTFKDKNGRYLSGEEVDQIVNRLKSAEKRGYLEHVKEAENIPEKRIKPEVDNSEEYQEFKEKALNFIHRFNDKVSSGEFVPLYIETEKGSWNFPGQKMRMVIYGPEKYRGRGKQFYTKKGLNKGQVIKAHEIVNPEAIDNPDEIQRSPHIHWELNKINKPGYFEEYM